MGRNWLQGLGADLDKGLPLIASCFDATTRGRLLATQSGWRAQAEDVLRSRVPVHPPPTCCNALPSWIFQITWQKIFWSRWIGQQVEFTGIACPVA